MSCSTDEKKLYQELEQFYRQFSERCFASDSLAAYKYQVLTELAASKNISVYEVRSKLSALSQKWEQVKGVTQQLSPIRVSKRRKLKKAIKKALVSVVYCIELITEIIEDFWDYLSTDLQEVAFKSLILLSQIDTDAYLIWADTRLSVYGKLSDIGQKKYCFYRSISRLRSSIKAKTLDEQQQDDDWYEPKVMKCFLDFLVDEALSDRSKLVPYTEEMSARARDLIAGVHIDDG